MRNYTLLNQNVSNIDFWVQFFLFSKPDLPLVGYCQPATSNRKLQQLYNVVQNKNGGWLCPFHFLWSVSSPFRFFGKRMLKKHHSVWPLIVCSQSDFSCLLYLATHIHTHTHTHTHAHPDTSLITGSKVQCLPQWAWQACGRLAILAP